MKSKTTIALIDDHQALTDALTLLLNNEKQLNVMDVAHDFISGMQLINKTKCQIIIIDMNLGKEDSCELISRAKIKKINSIILSAYSDPGLIKKAFKAGANAYISKSSASKNILKAIDATLKGNSYMDQIIQNALNSVHVDISLTNVKEKSMYSQLTPREKEVLQFINLGYTSAQIAKELYLSKNTIDSYRKNLKAKLHLPFIINNPSRINAKPTHNLRY